MDIVNVENLLFELQDINENLEWIAVCLIGMFAFLASFVFVLLGDK